ncbi:MAG TPA: hypothetical protein DCZ94_13545 [Lentisphaeria bacterium]|nr:MAG: hypothetical protein A2X48_18945 [Lentisphaerae bacterium GWF2_49_21]HBC87969.1 hypothetical protein [Lentisphaeria bacterium]
MKTLILFITILFTIPASTAEPVKKSKEIEIMISNFREFYLEYQAKKAVPEYVASCRDDGSWKDIDYSSKDRSGWDPMEHVDRLFEISLATFRSDAIKDDRQRNLEAIHRALAYWRKHDFKSDNWWCNNIGVPDRFGRIAVIMGSELNADEYDYIVNTVLPRSAIGMTGQNKVWLAGGTAVRAALMGDESMIKKAAAVIWDEVKVSEKEGVKPDYSFQQHGAMLQFGNYGLAYANDISMWAVIFAGTPWAMPPEKLDILRRYALDGQNWIVWKGAMDINSCGRQISPNSPAGKGRSATGFMKRMMKVDPENAKEYKSFADRNQADAVNDLVGNKYFWCSDYMVHRGKDFYVSLKMSSNRVLGMESINNENLLGRHLADGALYLYRNGEEYKNIFPIWDWKRIPGTTCIQSPGDPEHCKNWKNPRDFVGGVSDGVYGCAVMDFEHDGASVRKSWVFGDGIIFCFGSGVSSASEFPVATSVNQCLLNGDVKVKVAGNEQVMHKGKKSYFAVEWVEHDGWRYSFLNHCEVVVNAGPQSGEWSRVFTNSNTPKDKISKDVFSIWIDHDKKPSLVNYAYTIGPAGKEINTIDIREDKPTMQAVELNERIIAVAFWKPGKLEYGKGQFLEAGSPCLMILDFEGETVILSDPTQKLKDLDVVIGGKPLKVELPSGGDAGKSAKVEF